MSAATPAGRRIAVVTAGLGTPSSTRLLADRLAAATEKALKDQGYDATVDVVDLRAHAHDLADNLLTGFASPALQEAIDTVQDADAVIAVTPIFSASYSGLFKMFVDVLDRDALAGKPVLLAATGGSARHSLALEHAVRPLFSYLRAVTVPTAVYAAAEDWGAGAHGAAGQVGEGSLAARIDRAAGELASAVAGRPAAPAHRDAFADSPSFEDLLRRA